MEAEASAADYAPFGIVGLVIKGQATPYRPGRRHWQKWKLRSSSEAVVGAVVGPIERPESLVLGRVDDDGVLVIVARSVAMYKDQSAELAALLEPMRSDRHPWPEQISGGSFGGRTVEVTHVVPNRVVEISADAARLGSRYRHSARYLRWRADLRVEDVSTSSELG